MDDRIGQQVGNYRLIRRLGQGGFAEVYLAQHIHLDTQVAIKFLHTRLDANAIEQFKAEAKTISQLDHPHIVRMLDFGLDREMPYLIMSYAPYGTLRTIHPYRTRVPLQKVAAYVEQIGSALQYAHARRIVHRDIKPENMLIGSNREILLSDFGIALIVQSSRYESAKDLAGTIAYMAPEQIEAYPRPASDQYALGIMIYEWLCGERPFQGSFTEIAAKHAFVAPPPLRSKAPEIPAEVEQIVLTALAKNPEKRFGSVAAMARAFQQAVESAGIQIPEEPMKISGVQEHVIPAQHARVEGVYPAIKAPEVPAEPIARTVDTQAVVSSAATTPDYQAYPIAPSLTPPPPPGVASGGITPIRYYHRPEERQKASKTSQRRSWLYLTGIGLLVAVLLSSFLIFLPGLKPQGQTATGTNSGQTQGPTSWDAAHTNYDPRQTSFDKNTITQVKRDTNFQLEGESTATTYSVFYADDTSVYAITNTQLLAFNSQNGNKRWALTYPSPELDTTKSDNYKFQSWFNVANDVVYDVVSSTTQFKLYAFDLKKGKQVSWSPATIDPTTLGQPAPRQQNGVKSDGYRLTSLVVANGIAYFGEYFYQQLYGVDIKTGKLVWMTNIPWDDVVGSNQKDLSAPSVVDGIVYIHTAGKRVLAFDASKTEEKPLWKASVKEDGFSSPAIDNGKMYILSATSLEIFDAKTGTAFKPIKAPQGYFTNLVVTKDSLFLATGGSNYTENTLVAFDPQDGHTLWTAAAIPASSTNNQLRLEGLVVVNGLIFAGTWETKKADNLLADQIQNSFHVFDATTGEHLKEVGVTNWGFASLPVIGKDKMYYSYYNYGVTNYTSQTAAFTVQ